MATALYRRYRPETFSDMIGQEHVTEPLMTALRNGRIGHAYLFSGPRGCGKTTSARVLARCLNCAEGPTDTPCGSCPSCVELSRDGGGSLDVVEIDAASHGGVDDARELRERAVFAPARDRFKVFIIDEAHMVTAGGFNALLKIVEEPPPHVKFIFATTEPEKVIGTIRSRTHHYPFRLIAPGALIDYAQTLCDQEGVDVEPGVLPLVVRAGGGSVRDTLSILDQLIAGSEGTHVTAERAAGLLGFTSSELIDEVVMAIAVADAAAAFRATDRVVQTGQDPRRFVEDLLERLRDLIVISATTIDGAAAVFRGVPEAQLDRMFTQSQAFGRGELSRIADTVSAALDHMAGATAPRLQLELMIARALAALGRDAAAPGANGSPSVARVPAPSVQTPPTAAAAVAQQSAPVAPSTPPAQAQPAQAAQATQTPPAQIQTSGPAAPAAPPVDIASTLRSAREFIRQDSAGAGSGAGASAGVPSEQPLSPQPGAPGVTPAAAATAPAPGTPDTSGLTSGHAERQPDPISIDEVREVWPELLEELLESDRDAWNAVRAVQPLALEGDTLSIGVTSRSDLDAFKAAGAGPLREAIAAALGTTVRFFPRPVSGQASSAAAGPTQQAEAPPEPAEEPEPGAPSAARGAQPAPTPRTEFSKGLSRPASEDSWREPPAPAWAEAAQVVAPAAEPEPKSESEPELPPEPEPAYEPETGLAYEPEPEPAYEPAPAYAPEPAPAPEPEPEPKTEPELAPDSKRSPGFVRYGEAVVREVLGAKFVEERPLPTQSNSEVR